MTLASETGWSEHFILWELPLARLFQYRHVLLRSRDKTTVALYDKYAPKQAKASDQFSIMTAEWKK
jgi:hypothetical protein